MQRYGKLTEENISGGTDMGKSTVYFTDFRCPVGTSQLDKLKKSEIEPNLQVIRDTLELSEQDCLVPFSAEKGAGKNELLSAISQRLGV